MRARRFVRTFMFPTFLVMKGKDRVDGSKILPLLQAAKEKTLPYAGAYVNNTRDLAVPVMKRIFRDGRRMHIDAYRSLVTKISNRYSARALERYGFGWFYECKFGDVWLEDGKMMTTRSLLEMVAVNGGQDHWRIGDLSEYVAHHVSVEMKKRKYRDLQGSDRMAVIYIKEMEGVIKYGKAWIFRQKSEGSSAKRRAADRASINADGCGYQ